MIQLKPITKQDGNKLKKYYQDCEYGLCEYSVGTKMMWRSTWKYQWVEVAGCLVVRGEDHGHWIFDYPVAGPGGDEDAALAEIEKLCLEQGQQLMLTVVPECKTARLLARYPYLRVSDARTWRDYVYYLRISSSLPAGVIPASGTTSKNSASNGLTRNCAA